MRTVSPSRLILCLASSVLAQAPDPLVVVRNETPFAVVRTLEAAWPLPRHLGARALHSARVGDAPARWSPLLRWPDGALAVVQLSWRSEVPANSRELHRVQFVVGDAEPSGDVAAQPLPPDQLLLHSSVVDPWGQIYGADMQATARWRRGFATVTELAGVHRDAATDRGMLRVSGWLTQREGDADGELALALDNGRWQPGDALGPVRLSAWSLRCAGYQLIPQFGSEQQIRPTTEAGLAGAKFELLGPSPWLYLGDATAKVVRFAVLRTDGLTDGQLARAAAVAENPPLACADLAWVRWCGTFGLHGGPAPVDSALDDLATAQVGRWRSVAGFGPFGDFGDAKSAIALSSVRSGDSSLHNVVRWQSRPLLTIAAAMVAQGCLRPLPAHQVRLPAATAALRAGLSLRALNAPHGFEPLDYEHVAVDLTFDTYWLTGDPLALAELRAAGAAIRALLARLPFVTCRGEAACLRALVAIAWATQDRALLDFAQRRAHDVVGARLREHPVAVIAQPPHRDGLGEGVWFDAPWQMAQLVCALHALHRLEPRDELAASIEAIALRMAGPGWLDGQGPKYLVAARDANRFVMPRAYPALAGTAHFQLAAFELAAELTGDDERRSLFRARAAAIAEAARGAEMRLSPARRADPWFQVWCDRAASRR
jgi:hypothetical protein